MASASDHDGKHPIVPVSSSAEGGAGEGRSLVRGRLIDWDPATGLPVPTSRPLLTTPQIEALATTALSLLYDPEEPEEGDFTNKKSYALAHKKWEAECNKYAGMTCGEVMMVKLAQHAADGNHAATEELLDRVLGRPKQTAEVKSVSMKYEDYLKKMAEEEARVEVHNSAVDVEATAVQPPAPAAPPVAPPPPAPPRAAELPGLDDRQGIL